MECLPQHECVPSTSLELPTHKPRHTPPLESRVPCPPQASRASLSPQEERVQGSSLMATRVPGSRTGDMSAFHRGKESGSPSIWLSKMQKQLAIN